MHEKCLIRFVITHLNKQHRPQEKMILAAFTVIASQAHIWMKEIRNDIASIDSSLEFCSFRGGLPRHLRLKKGPRNKDKCALLIVSFDKMYVDMDLMDARTPFHFAECFLICYLFHYQIGANFSK